MPTTSKEPDRNFEIAGEIFGNLSPTSFFIEGGYTPKISGSRNLIHFFHVLDVSTNENWNCFKCHESKTTFTRNYHPRPKSIALCAASMSSSLSDIGSYHFASSAIPTWPPCFSWVIKQIIKVKSERQLYFLSMKLNVQRGTFLANQITLKCFL